MKKITEAHKQYIRQLIERRGGHISPEQLLKEAQRDSSPLHGLYDWDLTRSARLHWLERTREILRTITVSVETETQTFKAPYVVRDPDKRGDQQGYVSLPTLQSDPARARRAMLQECNRALEIVQRIRGLASALDLSKDAEEVLQRLIALRNSVAA